MLKVTFDITKVKPFEAVVINSVQEPNEVVILRFVKSSVNNLIAVFVNNILSYLTDEMLIKGEDFIQFKDVSTQDWHSYQPIQENKLIDNQFKLRTWQNLPENITIKLITE